MRLFKIVVVACFMVTATVLAGCSGGSSGQAGGVGAVSAKLAMKDVASQLANVTTVRVTVSGHGMTTIQQDFPAANGSGVVNGIPVGINVIVTTFGLDSSGNQLFVGSVVDVTVQAGQTKDVGTVTMQPLSTLTSITVTPSNPSITVGATQQLKALGLFSDGSTVNMTSAVTWSSSSTSIASVASNGIATALASGDATITAATGTVSGLALLSATTAVDPLAHDVWSSISSTNAPSSSVKGTTAVWTGSEVILFGNNIGIYNVSNKSWRTMSTANAPSSPCQSIWTGSDMIAITSNYGAKYNPTSDRWTQISMTNAPTNAKKIFWTDKELIAWDNDLGQGGRYNPITDTWVSMSTVGAPAKSSGAIQIWTGSELMVWYMPKPTITIVFGSSGYTELREEPSNSGAFYNPKTDSWRAITANGSLSNRIYAQAVLASENKVIIWGGIAETTSLNDGAIYDITLDKWTNISTVGAPEARTGSSCVWTGSEMIIWGGDTTYTVDYLTKYILVNSGKKYNPTTNTWKSISPNNAPSRRYWHNTVWTGKQMFVWGGEGDDRNLLTNGGLYTP